MALNIGDLAPEFALYDTDKNLFTLASQKGHKTVLLFFPLAFTSVCTAELCDVRNNFKFYEGLHANVFGISVDSLYTLKKFKEAENLNFPLLSDFNKEVSKLYGGLHETFGYGMKGVSKRAAFVLDEDLKVRYREVLENPGLQPNFERISEVLRNLQA